MAFQTNVFRGGEWVTETVDVHAVLKASAPKPLKKQRLLKPPECGVLTRTVVESQLVNSILPVRLRSCDHNDVAFVGVSRPPVSFPTAVRYKVPLLPGKACLSIRPIPCTGLLDDGLGGPPLMFPEPHQAAPYI